jgi:hypothetical protein
MFEDVTIEGIDKLRIQHENGEIEHMSIVFFGDKLHKEIYEVIKYAASLDVENKFYINSNEKDVEGYGLKYPGMLLLKSHGRHVVKYQQMLKHLPQIQRFVVKNKLENVSTLSDEDNSALFSHEIPYLILFIDGEDTSNESLKKEFSEIGKTEGENIKFSISDFTNEYQSQISHACNINPGDKSALPKIVIFQFKGVAFQR